MLGLRYGLRAVEPQDASWMYEVENDPLAAEYGDWTAPLSFDAIQTYALTYEADPIKAGQLRLIAYEKSHPETKIGVIDLTDIDIFHSRAFVGIYINEKFRRQGAGLELLEIVAQYASKVLGLHQIAAKVGNHNAASHRFFEKAGFSKVATLPNWIRVGNKLVDMVVYCMEF